MSSKVEISNMALTMLGGRTITSFTEDSANANLVAGWYPRSLKFCLNKALWTFATKRVNLTQTSEEPAWSSYGMDYAYVYPSDRVRIFGYSDSYARVREEADYIVSDTDGLGCLYVYFNDNPESYTPDFEEALAVKLASDLAYGITTDESIAKSMLEKFLSVSLPNALATNAQNSTPTSVQDDEWLRVKNGGYGAYEDYLRY